MKQALLAAFAVIFASSLALAADKSPMQPGLWQMNTKTQHSDPKVQAAMEQAQQALANMPPEQRKMMEDMMRKQGVSMQSGANGETVITMCVTQAQIDQNMLAGQQTAGCTHQSKVSGNVINFDMSCPEQKTSGKGTYVFNDGKSFTMDMTVNMEQGGKAQSMVTKGSGTLKSSDCGDVKPVGG